MADNFNNLKSILDKVAKENGFIDHHIDFQGGPNDGFIGLTKRFKIIEGDKFLSVMCKFLPNDSEHNKKFITHQLFEREVFVYTSLFPELEKIQVEHGLLPKDHFGFWAFPKYFYAHFDANNSENSVIVMEDLGEHNFEMKDRFIPSDFQHTQRVFQELGKLNAVAYALKIKKPKIFEQFKSMDDLICKLMTTEAMKDVAPRNCQLASEIFKTKTEQKYKDLMLGYKSNLWEEMAKVSIGSEPFGTLNHGDCWSNNMMYNYKDTDKKEIKDICIVDWQMARYGSPALDLSLFVFCCTKKDLRDEKLKALLDSYHESCCNLLQKLQLNPDTILTRNDLDQQLRKHAKFVLGMANYAVPLLSKFPEKFFKGNAELNDQEIDCVKYYEQKMGDIIRDLCKHEWL